MDNYRRLKKREIFSLKKNGCRADTWAHILINGFFSPEYFRNVRFTGSVKLDGFDKREININGRIRVTGLYNSVIKNCCIGRNVSMTNIGFLEGYDIGEYSVLENVTSLVHDGKPVDIKINLRNENGGRSCPIFPGITLQELLMISESPGDPSLSEALNRMTRKVLEKTKAGQLGSFSSLINCGRILNTDIDDYSSIEFTPIVENCRLIGSQDRKTKISNALSVRNGIMNPGSTITDGVIASDFFMDSGAMLDKGLRFFHSCLGRNSTASCGEIQSSLLFGFHEQHHSSSFLIAAQIEGQSNIAAGAVLGSNHNSRKNDGELLAGRGFWPGLCVSLKLPSVFASYSLITKGDYPDEIYNPFPFSLVSRDETENRLVIIPAFGFLYNLYALERNRRKYKARDIGGNAAIPEYHYLAADTVGEMFRALDFLKTAGWKGEPEIEAKGISTGKTGTKIKKIPEAVKAYNDMIFYYAVRTLAVSRAENGYSLPDGEGEIIPVRNWGGYVVPEGSISEIIREIKEEARTSWKSVSEKIEQMINDRERFRMYYAATVFRTVYGTGINELSEKQKKECLDRFRTIADDIRKKVGESRGKDYSSDMRKRLYLSESQMLAVMGELKKDPVIKSLEQDIETEKVNAGKLFK